MDLIEGDSSCNAMPSMAAVLPLLMTLSLVRQRRPVMHAYARTMRLPIGELHGHGNERKGPSAAFSVFLHGEAAGARHGLRSTTTYPIVRQSGAVFRFRPHP